MDRLRDDLEALRSCLDGGLAGADAFVRHFRPLVAWTVHGLAARRGRSGTGETEDWIQDVFMALLADDCRKLRQYDPAKCRPASWIVLIARQVVMKALARSPVAKADLPDRSDGSPPVWEDAGRREELERLRKGLADLPPREALCMALLVEQGMSEEAVARVMRLTRHAVRGLKERAADRLRLAVDPALRKGVR